MPKCQANRPNGTPCNAWAVTGSNPPRCSAHADDSAVGAPSGNRNAEKHGAYSGEGSAPADLDLAIRKLQRRLTQLDDYIDAHFGELDPDAYVRLANLQGNLTSRLGRLIRDQATDGADSSSLTSAIDEALNELSSELGIEL